MKLKLNSTKLGCLCCVVIAAVLYFVLSFFGSRTSTDLWSVEAQEETSLLAAPLVAAIESYRTDHDKPPATLDALIPDYITDIPSPTVGCGEWSYQPTKRSYELCVESSNPDPPPLILMYLFGPFGFDDRYFLYYPGAKVWEMADL